MTKIVLDLNGDARQQLIDAFGRFADEKAQEIINAAIPPVDTGFLRASAYVKSKRTNTFDRTWESGEYMSTKGRGMQRRERAPTPEMEPGDGVTIGWAAVYAWEVEDKQPFIYTALLQVAEG